MLIKTRGFKCCRVGIVLHSAGVQQEGVGEKCREVNLTPWKQESGVRSQCHHQPLVPSVNYACSSLWERVGRVLW